MAQVPNQGQSGNPTPPVNKKRFKWGCIIESSIVVALIALIGVILTVIIPGIQPNVCWGGIYGSLCHPPATPTISTSTARYNFENDAQNWEFASTQPPEKQSHLRLVKGQGYNNSQG